jgi:hypothetical protein
MVPQSRICIVHFSVASCIDKKANFKTASSVGIRNIHEYKYTTLMELYQKLFIKKYSNSNDALADVDATAKCFKELIIKQGFKIESV